VAGGEPDAAEGTVTGAGAGGDVRVRGARGPDERRRARAVVDAAMLEPPDAPDGWLVAVAGGADGNDGANARVLGALALEGDRIAAVAVRPGRRGGGIGTALVCAAADRRDRLVARFDPGVEPFYVALGFETAPLDGDDTDGRRRGVLEGAADD
jgi:GNAT superfamily N-acetyltransferase